MQIQWRSRFGVGIGRWIRLGVLPFALALSAAACTGGGVEEEQTTSTASMATTTTHPTTTTAPQPTTTTTEPPIEWDKSPAESPALVTLIDAGAEPREVRTYTMTKGTVTETTVQFGLSQVQVIDEVPDSNVDIDVSFELTAEVTDVLPEGFVVSSTYGDYRVTSSDRATKTIFDLVYGVLPGSTTLQLVSPSGQVLGVASDAGVDDLGGLGDVSDVTSAVAGAVAPLPAEPIGVGAKWQVVSEIEVGDSVFVQTAILTLLEVNDPLLVVEIEIVQELGPEGLVIPGLEAADIDVRLSSGGLGAAVWDLSGPLPVSASSEAMQTLQVMFSFAGEKSTLEQTIVTRLEMPSPAGDFAEDVPDQYVSLFDLNEGDCFDETDWALFGLLVNCSDPHDYEVFAVFTRPDEPGSARPDADEAGSSAFGRCGGAFAQRVDLDNAGDLDFGPVAIPFPLFWDEGHRTSVCAFWSEDLTQLSGSRLLTHAHFGALTAFEFVDQTSNISFPGFTSADGLNLVGSAHQENERLALTTFTYRETPQRGAAWFAQPVPVQDGFVTAFVFQLEMYSWFTVGDGFAFVIQNQGPSALGEGIGYNGIANSVAIEFDTLRQSWLGDPLSGLPNAPDLLANHVSVHTRGTDSNDSHERASLGLADVNPIQLSDRAAHVALIKYVPGEMTIFIDDFHAPVLTISIDLAETLELDGGNAYVGFTASTGPRFTGHKILRWDFASAGAS